MLIGLVLYFIIFFFFIFSIDNYQYGLLRYGIEAKLFFPFDLHHIPCSAIKDRLLILLVGELKQCHRLYIGFF